MCQIRRIFLTHSHMSHHEYVPRIVWTQLKWLCAQSTHMVSQILWCLAKNQTKCGSSTQFVLSGHIFIDRAYKFVILWGSVCGLARRYGCAITDPIFSEEAKNSTTVCIGKVILIAFFSSCCLVYHRDTKDYCKQRILSGYA